MRKVTTIIILIGMTISSQAQVYEDYIGAGHSEGIIVTSSSEMSRDKWTNSARASNTINGHGLTAKKMEASRFISQSTLGTSEAVINQCAQLGLQTWFDEQLKVPTTVLLDEMREVHRDVTSWFLMMGGDSTELGRPGGLTFDYTWWTAHVYNEDYIRQRVANALSEILVVSLDSDLGGAGLGLADYYDIFLSNAFGNYKDILLQVSLHPVMGSYLSHLNNPKTIPEDNIHPDENYAREIMQLFSLGLYELNIDGSRKLDTNGDFIPTYNQNDTKELAKVFTGLGVSDVMDNMYTDTAYFGLGIYLGIMHKPMKMYEEWHELGPKTIVGDYTILGGQSGMKDIEDAVTHLFNHPNVGPFISYRLIQNMIKSNPTPEYIARVASKFNDNGQGVRGDMSAVIKAILFDEEARSCDFIMHPTQGKLRSPFLRYTHFSKAIPIENIYGDMWNQGFRYYESTGQHVMHSPSVFNFYLPDYIPLGGINDNDMVGPEYQIHNSRTSLGYINQVNAWTVWNEILNDWEEDHPGVFVDIDQLKPLAREPEVLMNKLDEIFTVGQLSDRTRNIIKDAIDELIYGDYRTERVQLALYLIMISPDYAILK